MNSATPGGSLKWEDLDSCDRLKPRSLEVIQRLIEVGDPERGIVRLALALGLDDGYVESLAAKQR